MEQSIQGGDSWMIWTEAEVKFHILEDGYSWAALKETCQDGSGPNIKVSGHNTKLSGRHQ